MLGTVRQDEGDPVACPHPEAPQPLRCPVDLVAEFGVARAAAEELQRRMIAGLRDRPLEHRHQRLCGQLDLGRDAAVFACFRRAAERPEFRIEKRPALRNRQGMWALIGEGGAVIKRGHELGPVLAPVERRLMKLVEA